MGNCSGKRDKVVIKNKKPNILKRKDSIFSENITKLSDYKKKYEYISSLGKGGFGKVCLFRDKNCRNLKYAIKTLKKNYFNSHNIQCIIDEIKILRSLDHPNIVRYFETYEEDNYIHIVMEYIPGQNFFELLTSRRKKDFTEYEVCQIITSILKSIAFIHRSNIIHRDIKPENILFSDIEDFSSLKLIDFGLSVLEKKTEKYRVGSPFYMAPEMINGNYSNCSDMWSLGVILFLILTGKLPFEGKEQGNVYKKISKGIYDKTLLNESGWSAEIKDFVKKCLVVKESDRITSDGAFEHPWISKFNTHNSAAIINESILESLRSFSKNNILQKEIFFYLAKISNEKEISDLKKAFDEFDQNNTGILEFKHLENIFKKFNIKASNVNKF